MNGRAVVEVRDLTKVYLPSPAWMRIFLRTQVRVAVRALDSISLHVEGGQICAIAGPNGAGKTTLFKILTGLLAPTSGSAAVLGIDATRESPQLRRVVGFMSGEDRSLWLRLTCVQNLEFRGRLQGLRSEELRARIADVLAGGSPPRKDSRANRALDPRHHATAACRLGQLVRCLSARSNDLRLPCTHAARGGSVCLEHQA